MRRVLTAAAIVLIAAIVLLILIGTGVIGRTAMTAARFSALRSDTAALRAFITRMPKGADLHVHLSGAVYAEDLIAAAAREGLCFQLDPGTIVTPPCDDTKPPVADATNPAKRGSQSLYDRIVNALSMRSFLPSAATPSAHDQFFVTFAKFGEATWRIPAEMTATLLRRYAADAVQHTELMMTLLPQDAGPKLTGAISGITDSAARLAKLKESGLDEAVADASKTVDGLVKRVDELLGCDAQRTQPGCGVSYKYIAQVNRNADEAGVFVQTAFAAALIRADKRVGGLNFVGPEDYRVARSDYRRQMEMVGFLTKDVAVALHAGELWIGFVPPEDLAFHIRAAVEVAGARRIGHGVDVAYERGSAALLETMRTKPVAVEINLTSNDVILGVRGKDHPLMTYWNAGVPVTISTDDMGVSRIDLSNEYVRAARDYPLGYRDLRAIARNGIAHAFLSAAERDDEMRRLDASFDAFERSVVAAHGVLDNIVTLMRLRTSS